MITISRQDNGVLFTFENSDKYLYGNGSILVPFNSLSIVADESDMITLKKAASNDIFLSARYDTDLGYRSKDDAIDDLKDLLFAETGGGGGGSGVTPSEVQEMIDESISGKADTSAVTTVANDVTALSGQVATKVATSDFNAYSAATDARLAEDEEVTAAALNNLDERIGDPYQKVSGLTIEYNEEDNFPFIRIEAELEDGNSNHTFISDAGVESTFENNTEGSHYSSYIGQGSIGNSATDSPDENVTSERSLEITTDGFRQTTDENYNDGESSYARYSSENEFNYSNGLTLSQSWYDPENDETTNSSLNIINNGEGETYIELTDVDENSVKIETTGITINGDAVVTEDQLNGYQPVLSAGTGIEISGNVISATGGGATYSAGTNISIDTANTINCTLPISAGTGEYSLSIGNNGYGISQVSGNYAVSVNGGGYHPNTVRGNNSFAANMDNQAIGEGSFANGQICIANGKFSHAEGAGCTANTYSSHAEGCYVITNNNYEHSQGKYNVSNSGSTESGQTLFSVGNGTSNSARHNAFEIRQNGDIYVNDGTNDVRLQDTILALGGLKLVKLTQAEYDNLATKDANTLYIISNVVS